MDRILLLVVVVVSLLAIAPRLDLFRSSPPANPITTGSLPPAPAPQAAPPAVAANVPSVVEPVSRQETQPPVAVAPSHIAAPSQMPPAPAPHGAPDVAAPVAPPVPVQSAPPEVQPAPAQTVAPAQVPVARPVTAAQPSTAPQVAVPDPDRILLLVRTALLSLNDAMRTGNYTVLRDIGGPYFKDTHSAARLSQIFAPLAAQNLDLSMVAVMAPVYSEAPLLDIRNTLRIRGHFPGRPVQLAFDILYEPINGHWRLYALTAGTQAAQPEPVVNRPAGSREPTSRTAVRN